MPSNAYSCHSVPISATSTPFHTSIIVSKVHPPLWRLIVHIVSAFLQEEPSPLTLPPIPIIRAILCRIRNARAPLIVSLTSSHLAMHCPDSEQRFTMFDCRSDIVRFSSLGLFPQRHDSWLEISVAVGAPSAYLPVARDKRYDARVR